MSIVFLAVILALAAPALGVQGVRGSKEAWAALLLVAFVAAICWKEVQPYQMPGVAAFLRKLAVLPFLVGWTLLFCIGDALKGRDEGQPDRPARRHAASYGCACVVLAVLLVVVAQFVFPAAFVSDGGPM